MIDEREQAEQVVGALSHVIDPELGIDIISLGLVYRVAVDECNVDILMTLTVPGCPMHATIMQDVKQRISALPWAREIRTELTFEPPWTPDRLSPEARQRLGR